MFSKLQKIIDSFKGFSFRLVLLKIISTRVFFTKVLYIASAITIFLPCFFESSFIYATEMIAKHEKRSLMTANSIEEDITTSSGNVDTCPVNKKLLVEKFDFRPESKSKLFSSIIEDPASFSAFAKEMCETRSDNSNNRTTNKSDDSIGHLFIPFVLGFGITIFIIICIVRIKQYFWY